jgi:hypothetical protein
MRAIGMSERVLGMAVKRAMQRKAFGQELARHGTVQKVRQTPGGGGGKGQLETER